jgi:hypothetical protein
MSATERHEPDSPYGPAASRQPSADNPRCLPSSAGRPYRWVQREVARLPRQVAALMLPRTRITRRNSSAVDGVALAAWLRTLQVGERHDGLFWAASRLHEFGAGDRHLELLLDAAEDIGVNRREAQRVIDSAEKKARA